MTGVPAELIAAYRAAIYRVMHEEAVFVLRVGQASGELARLMRARRQCSALFLTACNPYSELRSEADNRVATAQLRAELARHSDDLWPAEGLDPEQCWPPEPGFLVLGLEATLARSLGERFGQNALVWSGADAVPELMLLR